MGPPRKMNLGSVTSKERKPAVDRESALQKARDKLRQKYSEVRVGREEGEYILHVGHLYLLRFFTPCCCCFCVCFFALIGSIQEEK
jgi:hypothetical protein